MATGSSTYRVLIRLYPKSFRSHYGDDLALHFHDLVERDGPIGAWRRTALDLMVTVPRYRLESVMNTRRTTATLVAIITALVLAAVGAFAAGFGPVALVAVALAIALGIAQRSGLARSMRPTGSQDRRRILRWSALLAGCCAAVLAIGLVDLGGRDTWPAARLITYNLTFFLSGLGAMACLVVGLRRPALPAT